MHHTNILKVPRKNMAHKVSLGINTETYDGETRSESRKLVFGCF